MSPQSATPPYTFATSAALTLEATFDGGRLTSDGGLPWLAEAEESSGICRALAACVPEWRRAHIDHSIEALTRQRVFGIACGYEDQNDADTLRADPLLKLVCGRRPESDADLASQPTMSRFENAVDRHACRALAHALLGVYLRARARWSPPAHRARHRQHRRPHLWGAGGHRLPRLLPPAHVPPLLVFDGDTDQLVAALLRPSDAHASRGVISVLRVLIRAVRARWSGVTVEIRADGGCAVPALYAFCEREHIGFTIGLLPNPRLHKIAAPLLAQATDRRAATGEKTRLVDETTYQAGSWDRERRVVYKAEALDQGPNTRFVVTTRTDPPAAVYD